jgi:hypothetical protein
MALSLIANSVAEFVILTAGERLANPATGRTALVPANAWLDDSYVTPFIADLYRSSFWCLLITLVALLFVFLVRKLVRV